MPELTTAATDIEPSIRFDGQVVVVTGAGFGLGREHALLLGARGATVVVNDVSASGARRTTEDILNAGGQATARIASIAGCGSRSWAPATWGWHSPIIPASATKASRSRRCSTTCARKWGSSRAAADATPLDAAGEARFERLRGWRAVTAKEAGLPAYVVFHDATLRQVAAEVPTDKAALGGISGIGAGKLEKWGDALLEVLAG